MEYITRQEKYLAYLAQLKTGKLPAPQTREEIYLAAIAGLYKKPLPYPQTRVETYLKAIADGKTTGLPDPKTRKEYYLYAIATDDTQRYIPTPITREEQLLDKVVNILVGVEDVTVSGSGSAMLYNAANHGFTGLTLYGKSTQMNTTGAQLLPFEVGKKGINFEVFEDGIALSCKKGTDIYAVGRPGYAFESAYDDFPLLAPGEYYIYSGTQDVYLYVVVWRKGENVVLGYSVGTDAKQIEIMDGDKFRIFLRTAAAFKGKVKAMITRTPMNATSYEPYKPAQALIIPTPNGLLGIPVASGGNYTDADGQQWVCDEVDFKKGVYVQRVATETPKAKWKNFEETADVPNRYRISGALVNRYRDGSAKCLISHGIYANWGIAPGWALNSTTFYYHPKEDVTKEEAKEQILGFINSANPLTFLGQLETPIEKPLTTEQLATYKALRTYSPTTTVINDAGADMKITYRCNMKKTESELEALYADTEREFRAIVETEDKEE